jgi:hypothetical protein
MIHKYANMPIYRKLQALDQLLRIHSSYIGQRLPQVDHRGSPRNRPASKAQNPPLRLRKNQLLRQVLRQVKISASSSKPKIRGLKNAGVFSLMAVMALLLKCICRYIVKVTLAMKKMFSSDSQPLKPCLPGPDVPTFIVNLIQRE